MMPGPALRRSLLLGLLGLLLLGAVIFVMRRTGPLAPVRVTVATVSEDTLSPKLFGIGTVEARRSYLIGPTAAGRVARVLVDVGDRVKAGQLLAEMDPVDLDDKMRALDASILRAGSAIAAAQAQAADLQARRTLASADTERYASLARQGFISAGAMEGKTQVQASADAGVLAALSNLAAAGHDLERLKAERAGLLQQRGSTRLLATRDSMVLAREAEPGSTVMAGQAVLRLIDPDSLWIRTRFDQGRSAGLAPDLPAEVVLRSNTASRLSGTVARVEMQSDSVTEERIAQISVDALPARTAVGELAEVTLSLPPTARTLVLPNAAIRRMLGRTGVWLLQQGDLQFAPLRLGLSSPDGQVQILEGLNSGDRVVLYSARTIDATSRIQVVAELTESTP